VSTLPTTQREELERLQWRSLAAGGIALVVCVVGAFFSPQQFFRAYLAAYQFYLGIALGSWAILMLYHLTGGAWGFLIRRFLEAAMRTLPLLALLFAPIAFGIASFVPQPQRLYPWAEPHVVSGSEALKYNHLYLNAPFWWCRAAMFFSAWIIVSFIMSRWSEQQDETGEPQLPRKFRLLAAPSLVVYGATITFAAVDWVMSLQPEYHSTMFAPQFAAGQLVTAHAFALLVLAWLVSRPPLAEVISFETLNDLGNMLLTFLVIWAYMTFFEFMLVWIANLPEEVAWYKPRGNNGWQWVAWALFILHFAIPFFCLLMRDIKRDPRRLAQVAGLIFFMHLVFLYFQIMPAFPNTTIAQHWMDFLTPVGIGGIWLSNFLYILKQRPVLPLHDLNREEAAHLREMDREAEARAEAVRHG
jgi:hypothetical protein